MKIEGRIINISSNVCEWRHNHEGFPAFFSVGDREKVREISTLRNKIVVAICRSNMSDSAIMLGGYK